MYDTLSIDMGTHNTCMAYWTPQGPEVIKVNNKRLIPTCLEFKDDNIFYGEEAYRHLGAPNVIYGLKRIIGHTYSELQDQLDDWPFKILKDEIEDKPVIYIEETDEMLYPEVIYGQFIYHLKETAEKELGREFQNVIITFPAFFSQLQKDAIMESFNSVFRVEGSLFEPTAAALAYFSQENLTNKKVFIFDLGGGTFDITILQNENGNYVVKGTGGDEHLGGIDFTEIMKKIIVEKTLEEYHTDISNHKLLFSNAEEVKKAFSINTCKEFCLDLDNFNSSLDGDISITRDEFNDRCMGLFNKCRTCIMDSLQRARLSPRDIDYVVMIGGSSRIFYIEQMLNEIFGDKIMRNINADEAVAKGALYYKQLMYDLPEPVPKLAPKSKPVSPGSTISPGSTTTGGRIIYDGCRKSMVMELPGGDCYKLISFGDIVPCEREIMLETVNDYDSNIYINIAEGEEHTFADNRLYARLHIADIPRRPRGEVKVLLEMNVDVSSIVKFSASTIGKDAKIASVDMVKAYNL